MPRRHLSLRVRDDAAAHELRAGFARIRAELEVPEDFPPDVLVEAERSAANPRLPTYDVTDLPFLTIDPPGSTDLDQAMHIERRGNGYRVRMIYASSNKRLARLAKPATLGLSAPAPPTALFELVDGAWRSARYTAVKAESGFTSVLELVRPGTFLQAYDPATAQPTAADRDAAASPRPPLASSPSATAPNMVIFGGGAVLLLATVLLALRLRWTRSRSDSTSEHACS